MRYKIIFIICLFVPSKAFSQLTISGKIVEQGGNPFAYATVQLLNADSVVVKTDMSEEDGSFELIVDQANYVLKISQFGSVIFTKSLLLNDHTNLGIIKLNTTNNLATVTIRGRKPGTKHEFDKLIFDVEHSPLKTGYNGLEVLARSPKLQVNGAGEVLLRNMAPTIMINGRKLNLTGEDLANYLTGLNAEMIRSIEIQSLSSATTDASARAGVINIVLQKAPIEFSSTFNSSYTYRKHNIWSGYTGLNSNYGSDKWNLHSKFGYRRDNDSGRFRTEKRFSQTGGSNLATGNFAGLRENMDLFGGIGFYPDKKHEFGAEAYYNRANNNYSTPEYLVVRNPTLYSISDNYRTNDSKTRTWYTALNYTFKTDTLGSSIKFIGDVGSNNNVTNNNTTSRYTYGNFASNEINYLIIPVSNYITMQTDWNQKITPRVEINGGLKYGSVRRDNQLETNTWQEPEWERLKAERDEFRNTENISAGYSSIATKFGVKHSMKAGIRIEHTYFSGENRINNQIVSQNYTGLFPNVYYGYEVATGKVVSLNYSRSIQRPSFTDLNPFIRKENDYSYIMGNPSLKPQYTNALDLTFQLSDQSITIYGSLTQDVIAGVFTNIGNITYYSPLNFGRQKQIGIDYSYHSDLTEWLYTNISAGAYYYEFNQSDLNPSRLTVLSNVYTRLKLSKTWSAEITNILNSRFQNYVVNVAPQYRMDLTLQRTLWAGKATVKVLLNDAWNTQRDKNISTYNDFKLHFYQKRRTQSYGVMFVYNFKTSKTLKESSIQNGNEVRQRL